MEKMVEEVNAAVWRLKEVNGGDIKLTYNAVSGNVHVRIAKGYQFSVGGRMSIILGFGGKNTIAKKTTESPHVADLLPYRPFMCIVEIRVLNYCEAFRLHENLVTSLPKRLQTFSTSLFKPNRSKTWKFFYGRFCAI